jgi:hypothetical protein
MAMVGQGQRQKKNKPDMATMKMTAKEQDRDDMTYEQDSMDTAGQGHQKEKNRSGLEGTTTAKEQYRRDIFKGPVSGKYRHGKTGTTKGEEQAWHGRTRKMTVREEEKKS